MRDLLSPLLSSERIFFTFTSLWTTTPKAISRSPPRVMKIPTNEPWSLLFSVILDETEVFPTPDITPAPCPLLAEFVFFVVEAFELFAGFLVTTEVVPP